MNKLENYISDAKFYRTDLADDISRLKISKDELILIVNCAEIQKHYFSSIELKKENKSEWTKDYLRELVSKSVAECFTKEYLLYLYDVSYYVNNSKSKINKYFLILPIILIIIFMIFISYTCSNKVKENKTESTQDLVNDKDSSISTPEKDDCESDVSTISSLEGNYE